MKAPQKSLKDWGSQGATVTERLADRCGGELICGQCQMLLQSSEGCTLHCAEWQTQQRFPQTIDGFCLPSFAFAIDDARPLNGCFVLLKPIASFPKLSLNGSHRYDRLASTHQDLAKKLTPSNDEHTLDCSCQVRPANNLSCEPKVVAQKLFHTVHGALSFCLVYLTNLIVHCRSCLLSNVRQCLAHQSKVRSFGSPVGAL